MREWLQRIIVLTCLITISNVATANSPQPLIDADALINGSLGTDDKKALLLKYGTPNELKNNPLLKDVYEKVEGGDETKGDLSSIYAQGEGFAAITSPTAVADAIATVIAKRFKEELTTYFLATFRKKLETDEELRKIFPQTAELLLYGDPFNYKVFLSSLRGALDEDLQQLPENVPNVLDLVIRLIPDEVNGNDKKKAKEAIGLIGDVYPKVLKLAQNPKSSFDFAVDITQDEDIIKSIEKLAGNNSKTRDVLRLTNCMIKGFGDKGEWYTVENYQPLSNPEVRELFLGLLIQSQREQLLAIDLANGKNLFDFLIEQSGTDATLKLLLGITKEIQKHVVVIADRITSMRSYSQSAIATPAPVSYVADIGNSVIEIIKVGVSEDMSKLLNFSGAANKDKRDKIKAYLSYVNAALSLAVNLETSIRDRDYSKIVVHTLSALQDAIPESVIQSSTGLRELMKYTEFAVAMAGAKSSEDMVNAIESAALPAGSWRLKRMSRWSFSLNSYAGPFAGYEILTDGPSSANAPMVGFTAPVGVAFNIGFGRKTPGKFSKTPILSKYTVDNDGNVLNLEQKFSRSHSLSLFASLIDVGAIVAFRLGDEETPLSDNLQWRNLFAPGGYLVWGIGNTPLALGAGVQYGPELRELITVEGATVPDIQSRAFRVGVYLAVDIPFFHFGLRTDKVKEITLKEKKE